MNERTLDGQTIRSRDEFYGQFFSAVEGLMPDYGGRNLDALNDDPSELAEPLTIV
jgi:RNAse (barnase) inhibitor barstar